MTRWFPQEHPERVWGFRACLDAAPVPKERQDTYILIAGGKNCTASHNLSEPVRCGPAGLGLHTIGSKDGSATEHWPVGMEVSGSRTTASGGTISTGKKG